ncbi:MAG: hypothetical protein LC790_13550 [Actinobacteria bacterium]|nr:hypothetical protein [Actinomycetota bacterium]
MDIARHSRLPARDAADDVAPPVRTPAIQLGVRGAHLGHQNTAVVQTCVPTVATDGTDSYRLAQATAGKGVRPLT